jgi:hypothetical protein
VGDGKRLGRQRQRQGEPGNEAKQFLCEMKTSMGKSIQEMSLRETGFERPRNGSREGEKKK